MSYLKCGVCNRPLKLSKRKNDPFLYCGQEDKMWHKLKVEKQEDNLSLKMKRKRR